MTPGERVYRARVDRYTVVHRYYGKRFKPSSLQYTFAFVISSRIPYPHPSQLIVDTIRCFKTLGREREEQRDREEGGGEGRRHDGRRILYYTLVHAIKDYVDCLTLKTMWIA